MQPATPFPVYFALILFSTLTWEEISGYAPLHLWSVSLSCTSVFLLVVHSSIHSAANIKTVHSVPKASCHCACAPENNQSWSQHLLQREAQPSHTSPLFIAPLYLIETAVQIFCLFSFLSLFHPLPPRYHLSPSSFMGELIGGMYWSAEFHPTWLLLRVKTMGRSPPPSQLTADLREGNYDSNNAAVLIDKAWFLSAFNCLSYLLSSTPIFLFCSPASYLPDVY